MPNAQKTRIITLTDRQPVKIVEADWPILAQSNYSFVDSENGSSIVANLIVRMHTHDWRTIVYATYDAMPAREITLTYPRISRHVGEIPFEVADGWSSEASEEQYPYDTLIQSINRVINTLVESLADKEDDQSYIKNLAAECIAKLPPVAPI
jgi:hypothetical protein